MQSRFTKKAQEALDHAAETAAMLGHGYIGSEHLLIGLIQAEDSLASTVLLNNDVTAEKIINLVYQLIAPDNQVGVKEPSGYTPRVRRILENSAKEAARFHADSIGTEHLLIAIIKETESVAARLLNTLGVAIKKLYVDTLAAMGEDANSYREDFQNGRPRGKKSTQTLDQYSRDLTELARNGKLDPVIGRSEEIQRVIQILSRRTKNNPCLIGEPGVGKTAIAEGLAARIVEGDVPETIKGKRLLTLDLSGMVAGSKYRGEFEERIKRVINEVKADGNVLLFLDELHTIIGAGGAEGAIDASNILKPSLARGEIQLIGATTLEEYRKYIEKDAALERRFQPVQVEQPSVEDTVKILTGLRDRYEAHHRVVITDDAIRAAASLSDRYISDRYLPDKAIDLIDEAGARLRIHRMTAPPEIREMDDKIDEVRRDKEAAIDAQDFEKAARLRDEEKQLGEKRAQLEADWKSGEGDRIGTVDEDSIAEILAMSTGIPVFKLTEKESAKLLHMEDELHKRVIGQNEAVSALSKSIRRTRAGLKDPNRPGGSFIFAGPTGVGKTELAKTLAEFLFGDESALIQLDMSEFGEKHTSSRLFGAPPGYVGYDEGGQLTEKVRRKPFSVVLFDEIEKAHADIFNTLLQVLEDGRLTDSQGRMVDFKNTVIIMTTNLGTREINKGVQTGFQADNDQVGSYQRMKNRVQEELKQQFRPEFLNRVDEVIVFPQLGMEEIREIVDLMITKLQERTQEQDMTLRLTDAAREELATRGFDPVLGARPLRRTIQRDIEDALSEKILFGDIEPGQEIVVDVREGEDGEKEFTFNGK